MNRERPTVLLVMAILNFVFGGLFILCGLCGMGSVLFTGALFKGMSSASKGTTGTGPDVFGEMSKVFDTIPGYYPVQITTMLLLIVLNIVLIVAGVGLLQMKPWARWTSLGYGVASIFLQMVILLYAVFVMQPAMEKWTQDFTARMGGQPTPAMSTNSAISGMGSCFNFILYSAYPVALIIVMLLPAVGAAFSAPPLPPEEPPGGGYGGMPPSPGPGSPHVAPRRF
jgi:hypothetical protein